MNASRHMQGQQSVVAEAVGAFVLVLVGGGAILVDDATGTPGPWGIAVAFGATIGILVFALGRVSGAHFNPAVTLAFAVWYRFPWRHVPGYLLAQCAGAVAGAAVLAAAAPIDPVVTLPRHDLAGPAEFLATLTLAATIAMAATSRRLSHAARGALIGAAVAIGAAWAGPLSGGSMNPARTVGPAIVAGAWTDLWLYIAATIAGALVGMGGHALLQRAVTKAPEATA